MNNTLHRHEDLISENKSNLRMMMIAISETQNALGDDCSKLSIDKVFNHQTSEDGTRKRIQNLKHHPKRMNQVADDLDPGFTEQKNFIFLKTICRAE